MKLRVKKVVALVASVVMLASVGAACGSSKNDPTQAPPTQAPATQAPATQAPTEAPATQAPAAETPATQAPVAATEAPAPAPDNTALLTELPRTETLYFGGQQWGTVNNWNPYSSNANNAMAIGQNPSARIIMFETLYMYNLLDGTFHPLLAGAPYEWNGDHTVVTVKMNADAKWNDGSKVTAHDVEYTWQSYFKHELPAATVYGDYIESVVAADDSTVVITAKLNAEGKTANPFLVEQYIIQQYVVQKAWTQTLEARTSSNDDFANDTALDVAFSGPYGRYYDDDQKVVFIRNDQYWGKALWGSLPVPKYIAHGIYADNPAVQVALEAGEVDVDQQFINDVNKLWEERNLPISTYMDEPPYGICVTMPSAWFNQNRAELQNASIRRAIAMAVDYDQINQNAMTGQSPTFAAVPRSLMNPTPGEQAMYDHDAVKDLQWIGKDYAGAKALLDEAGIVDTDGDGIRELNGVNLKFNAVCPNGWTDWMASMEIVAAAGANIGIEITTLYPEWDIYQTVFTDGTQTEYDIFMWAGDGTGPTYPWARVRQRFASEYIGTKNNWSGNFGGYYNERADEIIKLIPNTTDAAELKALYTEAVKIYLEEVPSFALMYRPELFYAVNESVWTAYPAADDGRGIPPTDLTDGYGIAGLYGIKLAK